MKDQQKQHLIDMMKADEELGLYDEPNETLNEVALEFAKDHHEMYETSNFGSMHFGFIWGAKWQQEQDKKMYSEEEVLEHLNHLIMMPSSKLDDFTDDEEMLTMKWFEQFKKK